MNNDAQRHHLAGNNVEADEVMSTNDYESMEESARRFDDARRPMMDYKVVSFVVLLSASQLAHSAPGCRRSARFLQSPLPTFVDR